MGKTRLEPERQGKVRLVSSIQPVGVFSPAMSSETCLLSVSLLLVITFTTVIGNKDFYSTTLNTGKLRETHEQLLRKIRDYAAAAQDLTNTLNSYLSESDVAQVSGQWATDGDPLRTYLLIRRTSVDLDTIVNAVRKVRALDPLLEIDNLREAKALPDAEDNKGMARSLVRLQRTYLLSPKELAQGILSDDVHLPVKLTGKDCLVLGEVSEELTDPSAIPVDAKMWYQAGLQMSVNDSSTEVADSLNEHLKALKNRTAKLFKFPNEFGDNINTDIFYQPLDTGTNWEYILSTFRRLCRGHQIRAPSMDMKSFCHLRQGPHPYLKIRPLKVEVISLDPYLAIFHHIVGDKEIQLIKESAMKTMERSTHILPDYASGVTDIRVSGTSWLSNELFPSMTGRLEAMLGMDTNRTVVAAEDYQVLNYGVGGHYSPHQDFFPNAEADRHFNMSGNRIATLIIYLSEVEEGGATAFPYIGVSLKPIKGSAAFWWNLRSGGSGDYWTTHGGCPVIYGSKWVSNKWFRILPQAFRVPCGLQEYGTLPQY